MQNKTWPLLKTFVHGAYAHKLAASILRNTTGQLGYVQLAHNMYNVLETDDLSNNVTTMTHMVAAATTGSTLGNTYQTALSTIPQELMATINTITANQQSLYQHIALLT